MDHPKTVGKYGCVYALHQYNNRKLVHNILPVFWLCLILDPTEAEPGQDPL